MRDFTREEIDELHVIFRKAEESKNGKTCCFDCAEAENAFYNSGRSTPGGGCAAGCTFTGAGTGLNESTEGTDYETTETQAGQHATEETETENRMPSGEILKSLTKATRISPKRK